MGQRAAAAAMDTDTAPERTFSGHKKQVFCVDVVGDKLFTASGDHKIRMFNTTTGSLVRTVGSHSKDVTCVMALKDDMDTEATVYSGSLDKTARAWSESGLAIQVYKAKHPSPILCLRAHKPSGVLYAGTTDNTVVSWDMRSASEGVLFAGHTDHVRDVALHGGCLYTASNDGTVRVFTAATGECVRTLATAGSRVFSVHVMPRGDQLCLGTTEKAFLLVNAETGAEVHHLGGHAGPLTCVRSALWTNGYAFSGSADGTVRRWQLRDGACTCVYKAHTDWVRFMCFHDGKMFTASDDGTVRMWKITGGLGGPSAASIGQHGGASAARRGGGGSRSVQRGGSIGNMSRGGGSMARLAAATAAQTAAASAPAQAPEAAGATVAGTPTTTPAAHGRNGSVPRSSLGGSPRSSLASEGGRDGGGGGEGWKREREALLARIQALEAAQQENRDADARMAALVDVMGDLREAKLRISNVESRLVAEFGVAVQ